MSWSLLERFFESEHFNNDPSLAIAYLSRYANHIGIQYVLCSKLRRFPFEEIEFFLPQLCHLLVSAENESMALEEFVLDLCQESVSGALLTFWLFQTHLHDLSNDPTSLHFKTCRRIFIKVQHIVFGASEPVRSEKIRQNILPTTVLASIILAGVAVPFLPRSLGPLAITQARKPDLEEDKIPEAHHIQVQRKISRSNTVTGSSINARERRPKPHVNKSGSDAPASTPSSIHQSLPQRPSSSREVSSRTRPATPSSVMPDGHQAGRNRDSKRLSTASLPALATFSTDDIVGQRRSKLRSEPLRQLFNAPESIISSRISREKQIHLLRSNYFRSETQFLAALEGISQRLVCVPKPARLSALRAELALVARDLPAEIDIPLLCPATLIDGSPSRSRHHRIVRINPAEATSLNSAERVPYLLMIEILRDDFDFDPETEANKTLLATLQAQKQAGSKRRLFDIGVGARLSVDAGTIPGTDSVFEPATGDLSSPSLLKTYADNDLPTFNAPVAYAPPVHRALPPRSSSGATRSSLSVLSTPRSSDVHSRSSSPGLRNVWQGGYTRTQGGDQTDISALATHMRTAAQMLAQLNTSGAKRPRQEVEAIKQKIIASMQLLEEQNFYSDDPANSATFDSIMASVQSNSTPESPAELDENGDSSAATGMGTGAGAARMENDEKTGGVRRTAGDREDPSAATFGEDWKSKRERIRRSSPYGYMENWDLLSVIVKTGSDLRQEMFATQLIRLCSKIWEDASVPVWLKEMRILVTGESSGLIETIANGVSLHSLKRSLTLATIAAGTNPRKRVATLKDHFIRTFGDPETPGYRVAADAFTRSLAAYSIISYVLQLKDRHNGNLLIDNAGHITHIDFGFMLSNSPGSVGFEAAPFKLTYEFVEVLGGVGSPQYEAFKTLCKQAFLALRKSAENIISVVEMMGKESKMACFASGGPLYVTSSLRQRLVLQMGKEEAEAFVEDLIAKSLGSYYTRLYDTFQYRTQGIY